MDNSVYVIRTNDNEKDWLWAEIRHGRLRQGWGVPGTALIERDTRVGKADWIEAYAKSERKYWGNDADLGYASKRYNILSVMCEIQPGDLVVIPKMPKWQSFTICAVTAGYSFDADSETPRNDYRHIIPVDPDSMMECNYWGSAEARVVKGKFRAYQSAVNRVYNSDMQDAVRALLAAEVEPGTTRDLAQIYSELESEVLAGVKDKLLKLPWEDLEQILGEIFVAAGYDVEHKRHYDREGGDADLVLSRDLPVIGSVLGDLSTRVFIQVKKKTGIDSDDVEGVRQLIKITETEVNAIKVLITTADRVSEECLSLAKANDVAVVAGEETLRLLLKYY